MPLAFTRGSLWTSGLSGLLSAFSQPRPSPSPRVLASGSGLGRLLCGGWWWCLLGGIFSESGFSWLQGAKGDVVSDCSPAWSLVGGGRLGRRNGVEKDRQEGSDGNKIQQITILLPTYYKQSSNPVYACVHSTLWVLSHGSPFCRPDLSPAFKLCPRLGLLCRLSLV